eukprot:3438962-Rhodomonas_salina.2
MDAVFEAGCRVAGVFCWRRSVVKFAEAAHGVDGSEPADDSQVGLQPAAGHRAALLLREDGRDRGHGALRVLGNVPLADPDHTVPPKVTHSLNHTRPASAIPCL